MNDKKNSKIVKIETKPCVECGFPIKHFHHADDEDGIKIFTQNCPNCSRFGELD